MQLTARLCYVPGGAATLQRLPVWVNRQGQEIPISVPAWLVGLCPNALMSTLRYRPHVDPSLVAALAAEGYLGRARARRRGRRIHTT